MTLMGRSRLPAFLCLCVGVGAWLCGCADDAPPAVVVYVSVDPVTAQPILDTFSAATGVEVLAVDLAEALPRDQSHPEEEGQVPLLGEVRQLAGQLEERLLEDLRLDVDAARADVTLLQRPVLVVVSSGTLRRHLAVTGEGGNGG